MTTDADLVKCFNEMDKNKDGCLSREEISNFHKAQGFDCAYTQNFIQHCDVNKDGKISLDEYKKKIATIPKAELESAAFKKRFDKLDLDKNGYVELKELKAAMQGCADGRAKGLTDADLEAWIKAHDANKDGKISYDEFCNFLRSQCKSHCK